MVWLREEVRNCSRFAVSDSEDDVDGVTPCIGIGAVEELLNGREGGLADGLKGVCNKIGCVGILEVREK